MNSIKLQRECKNCKIKFSPSGRYTLVCDMCIHKPRITLIKSGKGEPRRERKDTSGHYEKEVLCKVCDTYYGTDVQQDNYVCPNCDLGRRRK